MSQKKKRDRTKQAVEVGSKALVQAGAATVATMAGASPGAVAGAAIVALLPLALTNAIVTALGWKQRDVEKWYHELVHGEHDDDVTPEEIEGRIDAHQDEPYVRETILRSVRELIDQIDPASTRPLAVLAREYLREKKAPDAFFRGCSRLLSELSADELAELRDLIDWILAESKGSEISVMARDREEDIATNVWRRIPWQFQLWRDRALETPLPSQSRTTRELRSDPFRLAHLLRVHGLGRDPVVDRWDSGSGAIDLERPVLEHLRKILGAPA